MVVFSYYPADPRPRREAEALVEAGYSVDIICLRNRNEKSHAIFNQVVIHRIPIQKKRGAKTRYLFEYATFFILSLMKLSWLFLKKRFAVVHIHNMPDVLVFTGLLPKLFRRPVILDLHDPMPEVYTAKYGYDEHHPIIKILICLEKLSISFCSLVLTPNIAFRNRFISRGCPPNKIEILMNSPQETIFAPATEPRADKPVENHRKVLMFHGTVVERHGLDLALHAIKQLKTDIPNLIFEVYGEGDYVPCFLELTKDLGLQDTVRYYGHVSMETIAKAIQGIDLGVIPNRRSPFTDINMPTRIFEYLSVGKPVVAPRTPGIQDYFAEEAIFFFTPNDIQSLKNKILACIVDHDLRKETIRKGTEIYQRHSWQRQKYHMVKLYKTITP